MTGSNLPPGVSVNDIPGNRPEDMLEEAFWEKLEEKTDLPDSWWEDERIVRLAEMARDLGYIQGLGDGRDDEAMAQMHREEDHAAMLRMEQAAEGRREQEYRVRTDESAGMGPDA